MKMPFLAVVLMSSIGSIFPALAEDRISEGKYWFDENDRITCVAPEPNQECRPLPSAIVGNNIELYASDLENLLPSIRPDGKLRQKVVEILGYRGLGEKEAEALDAAIDAKQHAWHNSRQEKVFQAKVGKSHVLFLNFFPNGEIRWGATVPIPVILSPAETYLANGDYARCAQQALLDAGFDPKGVDGAPGNGARQALVAWTEKNGFTMPSFTRETASQICHVLTAPEARYMSLPVGRMIGYPGAAWNGWTNNSGGLHEFAGVDVLVRYDGNPIGTVAQIAAVDFGPGITYRYEGLDGAGNQINMELQPPFDVSGTVFAHGNDEPRTEALLALLESDTVGAAKAVINNQGGDYAGLVQTLREQPDAGNWSVIGVTSNDVEVLLADLPRNGQPSNRHVVIFADGNESQDQLLYAWHNRIIPGTIDIIPLDQ